MNKTIKKVPMMLLMLTLVSCNNSNAVSEGGAVKKGKAITQEEAKQQMEVAAKAMENQDALSLEMENASYSSTVEINQTYPLGKDKTGTITSQDVKKFDNVTMNLGFKGLTSTSLDDVKGYGQVKADVDIHGNKKGLGVEHTYQTPKGRASLDAYLDSTMVYLDLTDTQLQNVIHTSASEINLDSNIQSTLQSDKKIAFDDGLEESDLPLMTQEQINQLTYKVSHKIEDIASKGGKLKALEHDDGTYSYSVEAKDLKNASDMEGEIDDSYEDEVDDNFEYPVKPTVKKEMNVDKYSIAFVFDKNGIVSIGATIAYDASVNYSYTINGLTFAAEIKMNYALDFKVNFNTGDKVAIKEATDKDSYKVLTDDIDFDDFIKLF